MDQPPAQKPARAKKRADTSILKAERTLIETARIALRKGNISQALGLVAQHRLIYADGQLAEERDLISIRARVAAGRIKQARAESKRFFRRYPTSLLRPAVEAALRKRGK